MYKYWTRLLFSLTAHTCHRNPPYLCTSREFIDVFPIEGILLKNSLGGNSMTIIVLDRWIMHSYRPVPLHTIRQCLTPISTIIISYIYRHSSSFSNLSDDMSKASSKTVPPHSAIESFLLQMIASSPVLKVIQYLLTSSSSSSCHFYLPLYLSFNNLF